MTPEESKPEGSGIGRLMAAALFALLMHYALVQGVQVSSRWLQHGDVANHSTVLAVRFELVLALAVIVGLGRVLLKRDVSLKDIFHPGDLRLRSQQAVLQTGQGVFIILAAAELTGSLQAALSLALVPIWTRIFTAGLDRHVNTEGATPAWYRLFIPGTYAVAAVLFATQAGLPEGNFWLGLTYMVCSGACTALLHRVTDKASSESRITSTIWQNGPAALLTVPLWFVDTPGNVLERATLPSEAVALVVLALVAICSLGQQLALSVAYATAPKGHLRPERGVALRGAQVFIGAAADWLIFHIPVDTWIKVLAFAIVTLAMTIGWLATKPRKD